MNTFKSMCRVQLHRSTGGKDPTSVTILCPTPLEAMVPAKIFLDRGIEELVKGFKMIRNSRYEVNQFILDTKMQSRHALVAFSIHRIPYAASRTIP